MLAFGTAPNGLAPYTQQHFLTNAGALKCGDCKKPNIGSVMSAARLPVGLRPSHRSD